MKRYVIVGLGMFGTTVAETLGAEGHEVIAIDSDQEAVDRIGSKITRAAVGDARDPDALDRLGARDADVAVVNTGDDISSSVLAVLALQDLKVKAIYVKVVSQNHARAMRKLGVTEVVFPERDSARNLANQVTHSRSLLKYVGLGEGFGLQEMAVPAAWEGQSLAQLDLRAKYQISVVAIRDALRDELVPATDPQSVLKVSDSLLVIGNEESLERVAEVK